MSSSLCIDSEIGVLEDLMVHAPGPEIELMTPAEAEQDLYNDIIPLSAVRAEYDQLKAFLDRVTRTWDLTDALAESVKDPSDRGDFLAQLAGYCPIADQMEQLAELSAQRLATLVIQGIPAKEGTLASMLKPAGWASRPLPNAYFMRDSAAVVGDCVVSAATAFDVRLVESIVTRFIFTRHPRLKARELVFDGPAERNRYMTTEGGDILVLSRNIMAIGISERTTAPALERIARETARLRGEALTVLAVELPRERATIHLDMVFTMIDRDAALVYEPIVLGSGRRRVIRIEVTPDGTLSFSEEDGLIGALGRAGLALEPIPCGGGLPRHQEREQWLSGANSFAFAPGKILTYSCNPRTLEALSSAGFAVVEARRIIEGRDDPSRYGRLAVTFDGIELARGGGGARCMTLPMRRAPL